LIWHEILIWGGFNLFVVAMLVLDLGVFNRKAHEIHVKEALLFSAFWIALALLFNLGVYFFAGSQKALEFLTGYVVEKSLSVDNIFVFILIFSFFKVPAIYQHKVLFWGILGAIILRAVFIFTGVALIEKFHWIIYIFGAFLIYTGFKIAFEEEKEVKPENNPLVKLFRRFVPTVDQYENGKFMIKKDGKIFTTPLFLTLLVVETTDVVFAVDSIPAILAISRDPFIVYTSNIFAILGLRALYFALAGIMKFFHYLNYGLAVILIFVGIKMITADFFHIPIGVALGFIAVVLALSIAASIKWPKKENHG
jgi:tellurite resistance protein TerC